MTEYLIHKKGDIENNTYTTFDELAPLLKKGDIVTFSPGVHQYRGGGIQIDQLTLRGQIPKAYEKTVIVMLPNENNPKKMIINENGGIAIENISIVCAPQVVLLSYKNNASLIVKDSNIVWNHFKLKSLTDNVNLIGPHELTNILNTVNIENSIIASIDAVAQSLKLEKTVIGSPYGETSYLSGIAQDSTHVFLMNCDLGLVGEIYSFNMVEDVTIVDVDENLEKQYPNLNEAPFIINNLLFKARNIKATKVLQTWDNVAEGLYQKKLKKDIADNFQQYYLSNQRQMSPLYIRIEPKGKGKKYALPHDKPLFINYGKAVITGENNSKTAWANDQCEGELALVNYTSGVPFDYTGGDVYMSNVKLPKVKYVNFKQTLENPTIDIEFPTITNDNLKQYLLTQDQIDAIERQKTPAYNVLVNNIDEWLLSESNPPMIFISGVERLSFIRQMEAFASNAFNRGLVKLDEVVRIENALKTQQPQDLQEALIGHIGKLWININAASLLSNPNGSTWLNFYQKLISKPNIKTMIIFYDTPENIEKLYTRYPVLNKLALSFNLTNTKKNKNIRKSNE